LKWLFLGAIAAMCVASVGMLRWTPEETNDRRTPLVYVTGENPLRRSQAALFESMYPQSRIVMDPANGDAQKIVVQSLAGVGPDLFDNSGASGLEAYVNSGIAWDVTDELARRGIDVTKQTFPGAQGSAVYKGRTYGVPMQMNVEAIFYNKDVFDEAGIPYPKEELDWDELIALAKRLTVRDARGRVTRYGFSIAPREWLTMSAGFGGTLYKDGGRRSAVDGPGVRKSVQLIHDLIHVHKVCPSPSEASSMANVGGFSGSGRLLATGKYAMEYAGRYNLLNWREIPGLRLGIIPLPSGPLRRYTTMISISVLVNKLSPRREQALDYLTYLASPEYGKLVQEASDGVAPFFDKASFAGVKIKYDDEVSLPLWKTIAERTQPPDLSPYIAAEATMRIWGRHFDQVVLGTKEPAKATADAAREIDEQIRQNVEREPYLRKLWNEGAKG
jgi:multiple sugar transport system substrate-binding protein